jgi:putative transposase
MWTEEQRARHKVAQRKERKGYLTDISDREWIVVEPLLPDKASTGRPRKVDLRQVINALRYLVRSGCEWRMLPIDFLLIKRCTLVSAPGTTFSVPDNS